MSFGMFLAGAASGAAQGYMMHKMANRTKPDGTTPEAVKPAADTTATPAATAGATTATPSASGALTGATAVPGVKPLAGTVGAPGSVANPVASDQMAFNDTFNQLTEQEGMVG